MIINQPIAKKDQDLLNIAPLAKRMAAVIERCKSRDISAIGIEGEWGAGKTSFINLILEELHDINTLIVKFNPWNFSNPNELIKDLFNSIMDALIQGDKKNVAKVKRIGKYAYKLLKLSEVTVVPEITILGLFTLKLGEVHAFETPLEKQTEEINELLVDFGKKIIIIIDDIDRLDTEETKLVLKLVKIIGQFSNISFLLAYDRGIVCERLNSEKVKGDEYLKKIIQLILPLPKQNAQHLFEILCRHLDKIIKNFDDKYWDAERWQILMHSNFKKIFSNMQDVKLYVNSMVLDLETMEEVTRNPIDFIAIEAIRVFAPNAYIAIGKENKIFTAETRGNIVSESEEKELNTRKKIFEEILQKVSSHHVEIIRDIIFQLFPQIKALYTHISHDEDFQKKCRTELRVCSEDMFDRYFNSFTPEEITIEKSPVAASILEKINNLSVS